MTGPNNIRNMSETRHGIMWMVGGLLVLLYAFNLFTQSLNLLVILGGLAMIAFGFLKMDGLEKINRILKRNS